MTTKLKVGDLVQFVTPRKNHPEWYGTIIRIYSRKRVWGDNNDVNETYQMIQELKNER